nr:hypothetical protein [Tanacetum cinerariifolium]
MENYKNVSQDIWDQLNAEAEAVQITLTGIYNDIYSTVDACPNACETWKAIKRLKQVLTSITTRMTKQHQNEVNELRAERLARTTNPLALVSQQQPVYHPQNHPNHYTQDSSTRSQQAATKNREIYKPANNHLKTSSNTSRANQDNTLRINRGTGYDNQRVVNVVGARENVAFHKEKMLFCKQEEAGFQLNAKQADRRDETNDEPEDQELEAHYPYMAQIQEVTLDVADKSGPIFDVKPLQKVQNNDDNYNVFAIESKHSKQPKFVNDTYPVEQDEHSIIIDSLDMSYNREQDDQDDNDNLAKERDLLASLIVKLKCEIDDSKNRNKFLETSNKALVDILKGEIEDFKTKNKSLESSNNYFKEASNEVSKTNQLMFKDLKKFQAELDRYHDVNYASKTVFSKSKSVTTNNVSIDFSKPVTAQILPQNVMSILKNTNVIAPGMYKVYTKPNQTRTPQLPQDIRKTNKRMSFSTGVIHNTSVSRPQLKSNQLEDRSMPNNSQGNKQEIEDHSRNFKTRQPIVVPISTSEHKRTVNQSITTPLKRTIASESTNEKPRHTIRKLYEHVIKTCSWWYLKFTPSGYKWKTKSPIGNVNTNVSMPLGNESGTANVLEPMTPRCSKYMTRNLKVLSNFVEKFLGTVKFGNDQIALILGYRDLV